MADFRTATTVGARIAALRKARGFASTKALAEAIPGDSVTESILQNIEANRKNDLAVAQLLNIAAALRVSPLFILAPLGSPHEHLDLPNITPAVAEMSVAEFDAWVSGLTDGGYRPVTADELSERAQLDALRELLAERRLLRRLLLASNVETDGPAVEDTLTVSERDTTTLRIEEAERRISQLEIYLGSAGWGVTPT
ncbi:MAG TPA: helix-turn-helix domain-containing protein [Galbitalea sp.]|jgi:transcriptional regulator with XRE-family HTH domain|nr:helix-turn-helix domain-containing protein [Galbitalea sp.]